MILMIILGISLSHKQIKGVWRANSQLKNEKLQNYNKKHYDQHHKSPSLYNVGDFEMIKNIDVTPNVNKKLLPKYKGPYEIRKCIGSDRYLLKDVEGFQVTQVPFEGSCSADNIKLWLE